MILIAVIVALVTVLIMRITISDQKDTIKDLEKYKKEQKKDLARFREHFYDSTAIVRKNETQIIKNLEAELAKGAYREKIYQAEIRKVKGMYKGLSNDSLYKKLIDEYEKSTGDIVD